VLLTGAVATVAPTPAPASQPDPVVVENSGDRTSGDGLTEATAFVFEATLTCNSSPHPTFDSGTLPTDDVLVSNEETRMGSADTGLRFTPFDSWIEMRVTVVNCVIPGHRDEPVVNWSTRAMRDASPPTSEAVSPTTSSNVYSKTIQLTSANDDFRVFVEGNPNTAQFIFEGTSVSGGSCPTDTTREQTYTTPELWIDQCGPYTKLTGSLELPSTESASFFEYRGTLPANVDEILIETTGSMRYRALGDPSNPPPCGVVLDENLDTVANTSTTTGATGTANCVIRLTSPPTSEMTVFIPGSVIGSCPEWARDRKNGTTEPREPMTLP
jgi:hypothetical protein